MIVKKSPQGHHIIYQAAHGLLAGKIAQQLKRKYRPKLWLETLIAIVEHDDLQLNFKDNNYLSDIGMPKDFTEDKQNSSMILKRLKRIMSHANSKSSWTTLLVSFHIEYLYRSVKDQSKGLKDFLKNQEQLRNKILKEHNTSKTEAYSIYQVLLFCDRLSLILCKNEIPDAGRKIEINTSIDNKTYFLHQKDNGIVTVEPWCFEQNKFEISIEEIILKQTKFNDQNELKEALEAANKSKISWNIEKQ
ncbi:DUF3891 family protein [Cyclobacterium amurskyense]|uniref:DUF3891 domain-containing protein n=1 Tax=Cyclobacterium amurskyense TaxID=320787 RepID=A0A0H4Q0K1_9BACT|nr:DUF3891 family protein [Cyclobacterium amurskyense]AKP54157.1 hypothetical protein CA2015_4835 [Cyclobacterium amurskyense]|tara:strand:- start:2280 stop:3020 length:741 start_codon:yes stop_codon:yes gene_type:complete